MGKQVRVNLTVDEEVVKKAKELGLNISKMCENCLKEAIRRLETPNTVNNSEKGGIGTEGSDKRCGGWDLNPMLSGDVSTDSRKSFLFL